MAELDACKSTRTTLVSFLRARLDEDEEWAHYGGDPIGNTLDSRARILADVAAKRALIDAAARIGAIIDGEWGCCHDAESILRGHRLPDYEGDDPEPLPDACAGPKELRRILAPLVAVYDTHPDYDERWRP